MSRRAWLGLCFCLWPLALPAAMLSVSSSQLQLSAHDSGFWISLDTAANQELLYVYRGAGPLKDIGTSRLVFSFDFDPLDLNAPQIVDIQDGNSVETPVTAFQAGGNGAGSYIEMAKRVGDYVYGVRYTLVPDPHSGVGSGYMQVYAWVRNDAAFPVYAGLRELLDVSLIDNNHDNAPLSLDSGLSAIDQNTRLQALTTPIPSDWWTYDQHPGASLVARGVTWGNAFGLPATQPDAMEFCHWDEVAMPSFFEPHPDPGTLFSSYARPDSAVVLWFTGNGQFNGSGVRVEPGETKAWVTYYGVDLEPLGATPTPYATFTPSLSKTMTPSVTVTLTPTFTRTPTISPTFSVSPTHSISPTHSMTPTISPTFSISPTHSVTPTISQTFTRTPTPSVTPTISPSPTVCPTVSPRPSDCETLVITPKPPNPNPSDGSGVWLPYLLCRDAMVQIKVYDVAGELIRELEPYAARLGPNEQFWDQRNHAGARVASGIFLVRLEALGGGQSSDVFVKLAVVR